MRLKPEPFREVRRKLIAAGFIEVTQKGSHIKFARKTAAGALTTIVPHHREIPIGTLKSILKQAGITIEEFEKL